MKTFILTFLISFVVVYLLYLIFVILNKKKQKNVFDTKQASILINLNKLDINKLDKKVFIQCLSIANSFILSVTFAFAVSEFFKSFILNLVLSFILLMLLIMLVYKLMGFILRKEGK